MALVINNEEFTISNSNGATINSLVIAALPGSFMVKSPQRVEIILQVHPYATVDDAFESVRNSIKIDGFPNDWTFNYEYGIDDVNLMYWLDLKTKERILSAYPDLDEDNIIITTELE